MKKVSNELMNAIGWPFIFDNDPNANANLASGQESEDDFLQTVKTQYPDCVNYEVDDVYILYTVNDVPVAWYDVEGTFGYIEV